MDVFFVYLLFASATPLFLWVEKRKWAIISIPFVIALWVGFAFYVTADHLTTMDHTMILTIFIINAIIAHIAALALMVGPLFANKHNHVSQH